MLCRRGDGQAALVAGEHYLALAPTRDMTGVRYPDLLVAFGVDPEAYRRSNAYVISEQGKPPDLVLEVVSPSRGRSDRVDKRADYAAFGIKEYWRFDEKGRDAEDRLAGDVLVEGTCIPVEIEELPGGVLQGNSTVLGLYLRWAAGELVFYDPATGEPIASLDSEHARIETAGANAETERVRADARQVRAEAEREGRIAAEARVRELEERLRRQGG